MNLVDDALTALVAALDGVFVDPIGDNTYKRKVSPSPPDTVAAPAVWVEQDRAFRGAGAYVVTFPVQVVHDGADRAQVAGIRELVCRIADAAETVGTVTGWEPGPVDVGGPSLRGTTVTVDVEIPAITLCLVPLAIGAVP